MKERTRTIILAILLLLSLLLWYVAAHDWGHLAL